jgi:hypothetical protein
MVEQAQASALSAIAHTKGRRLMDWKLQLVAIPVSDVDRAKTFYTEKVGMILWCFHESEVDVLLVCGQ